MIDFTFKEIDHLITRGWLEENRRHEFGINHILKHTNQGFGRYSLTKQDNGEIEYRAHYPINVDPDDGRYDTKHELKVYRTFDDYVNDNPYIEIKK